MGRSGGRQGGPGLDPSLSKLSWSSILPSCWGWSWGSRMETAGLASSQVLLSSLLPFYVHRNSRSRAQPWLSPSFPPEAQVHGCSMDPAPPPHTPRQASLKPLCISGSEVPLPPSPLPYLVHRRVSPCMSVSLPFSKAAPLPRPASLYYFDNRSGICILPCALFLVLN